MFAHSAQGVNRCTVSCLAALESGEKTSWWGCSARNELGCLLQLQASNSLGLATVAMCVANTMGVSNHGFNRAHSCFATKIASAPKSGCHAENEKHVVWNLHQTSFASHTNDRAVITLMGEDGSWGSHIKMLACVGDAQQNVCDQTFGTYWGNHWTPGVLLTTCHRLVMPLSYLRDLPSHTMLLLTHDSANLRVTQACPVGSAVLN